MREGNQAGRSSPHCARNISATSTEASLPPHMLRSSTLSIVPYFCQGFLVRVESPAQTGCLPLFATQKVLAQLGLHLRRSTQISWNTGLESRPTWQVFQAII